MWWNRPRQSYQEKRKTMLPVEINTCRIAELIENCSSYVTMVWIITWIFRFWYVLSSKSDNFWFRFFATAEIRIWHDGHITYARAISLEWHLVCCQQERSLGFIKMPLSVHWPFKWKLEILHVLRRLELVDISIKAFNSFGKCYIRHLRIKNYFIMMAQRHWLHLPACLFE